MPDPVTILAQSASSRPEAPAASASPRLRFAFVAVESGTERWLTEAVQALASAGHDVGVIVPDTSWTGRLEPAPHRVRRITLRGPLAPLGWIRLRSGLAAWRPHLVMALDPHASRALERIARFVTAPVVSVHADPSPFPLPLGVRLPSEPVPFDKILLRRALRLPRRVRLILQVGDLVPGAGHDTLLRAVAILRDKGIPKAKLPTLGFVGTGPEESGLHVLAHDLGVKEHVLWIGFRKDVDRYIGAADAVVVPKASATTIWALLDAMARAVPVAAVDTATHRERIADGVSGLLVAAADPNAWAAALERFQDVEASVALGAAAHAAICAHASEAVMAAELESLAFETLIGRQVRQQAGHQPALFVDRDGTLVRNVPYNADPAAVQLEPGAARALGWVRAAGVPIVVVSNQSAIARGLADVAQVEAVNERMRELLRQSDTDVDAIYYCPHHPDHGPACDCRKPEPGLTRRAAADLDLDLARSVTVGDSERDLEAGRRAGTATVQYGGEAGHLWPFVVRDALAAIWARVETDRKP